MFEALPRDGGERVRGQYWGMSDLGTCMFASALCRVLFLGIMMTKKKKTPPPDK